jgi:hypothetical protein
VAWHPSGKTQENHPFLCLGLMCGQMWRNVTTQNDVMARNGGGKPSKACADSSWCLCVVCLPSRVWGRILWNEGLLKRMKNMTLLWRRGVVVSLWLASRKRNFGFHDSFPGRKTGMTQGGRRKSERMCFCGLSGRFSAKYSACQRLYFRELFSVPQH